MWNKRDMEGVEEGERKRIREVKVKKEGGKVGAFQVKPRKTNRRMVCRAHAL